MGTTKTCEEAMAEYIGCECDALRRRIAELEAAITAYLEEGGCEHPAKCIEDGVEIIACAERGLCEALYGKGGA